MYLESLALSSFRSCAKTRITFQKELTVLAGANNSGKSNVLEAVRLLTNPSEVRRERFADVDDVHFGSTENSFSLSGTFCELTPRQKGLLITTCPDISKNDSVIGFKYEGPAIRGERGRVSFTVGNSGDRELEPECRDLIRHVYLPALRDAQRMLSSGFHTRIALVLRALAESEAEVLDFEATAQNAMQKVESHPLIARAQTQIGEPLKELTHGTRTQKAALRFIDPELAGLASDLRFRMSAEGVRLSDLALSGLGYANLLYIATVLVELQAARRSELTLFLVEEPEAHLHPQLQRIVLDYLRRRAEKSAASHAGKPEGRIQIIATTHSPHLTASLGFKHVVVLKTAVSSRPQTPSETPATTKGASTTEKLEVTRAIPLARLALPEDAARKINRYLDVTRCGLLFAPKVVLFEGLAEALLLPTIARHCVLTGADADERYARFSAAALIPIDGVDFEPYIRLLLGTIDGECLCHSVVVVTDGDPDQSGNRKERLQKLALELGQSARMTLAVGNNTLEADLLDAGNATLLRDAFLNLRPSSSTKWAETVASSNQGQRLVELLAASRVRKGDFAQELANLIASGRTLQVPEYLNTAIVRASAK